MDTPDRHFSPTLLSPNEHRATARAIRPTQSAQRVDFASSECAPRRSQSDSTHPKCAGGSLRMLKMRTAPQRERPTQSAQRVHFAFSKCAPHHSESDSIHPKCAESSLCIFKTVHRATTRAMRPTQSAHRVHFACSKYAPRHSETDSTRPKCAENSLCIHFALTLHLQSLRRATARAIGPAQSAQRVLFAFSKGAPRHSESSSTRPKCCDCHDIGAQARKYCACHGICTKSPKVLHLPRNLHKNL